MTHDEIVRLMQPGMSDPLAELAVRPDWHAEAACRGMGPDLFFVERGQPAAPAKEVCRSCPVAGPCLDAAMEAEPRFSRVPGVWGGTSPEERRRLRRDAA